MTDLAEQRFTRGDTTLVWDSFGDRDSELVFVLLHGLGLGRSGQRLRHCFTGHRCTRGAHRR